MTQRRMQLLGLVLAGGLVACGSNGSGGGGGFVTVPKCGANQALATDSSGQLICKQLPAAAAVLPTCTSNQVLTGDGTKFTCIARCP